MGSTSCMERGFDDAKSFLFELQGLEWVKEIDLPKLPRLYSPQLALVGTQSENGILRAHAKTPRKQNKSLVSLRIWNYSWSVYCMFILGVADRSGFT